MSHQTYSEVRTLPRLEGNAVSGRRIVVREFLVSIRASHPPDALLLGDHEPVACYLADERYVTISDELVIELYQ